MNHVECIEDAYLVIEDGIITEYGEMSDSVILKGRKCSEESLSERSFADAQDDKDNAQDEKNSTLKEKIEYIDAKGGFVMPAFCDSHTHIVYAGCRDGEFRDKIAGLSYEEIAARGGGILNSADLLHETSEDELYRQAMERVREIMAMGTGAVEIKSGYGLTVEEELKMLRVIRRIKETAPITVKANFLGAHAVGRAYRGRQSEYVDLVCEEMMPLVAKQGIAKFNDVFCEADTFDVDEARQVLEAGLKYGLRPKIHADEIEAIGGSALAGELGAISAEHLIVCPPEGIEALAKGGVIACLLPATSFNLGATFAPARDMVNAGVPVAMATDFNPGSCPCLNMQFVINLGCLKYRLTPEEVLTAVTLNGAAAIDMADKVGSIEPGKQGDLVIWDADPMTVLAAQSAVTVVDGKVQVQSE